ncbi:GNAT family N-acetyltransferase [Paenibacillus glacialis]|uniref:GNAT family acetyltransferase n=1 Tax=Paenibacillus glacialis TaxID=494026 RepID=A0A168GAV2_9BACL|nr:GNAT family N-acetyltransferase [Paenibacillus glacialis]OAB36989.1 GNAT family acetyltransferase [Paenibacillus glacialis]
MQIKQTKDHELISQLNQEVQNIHATMYPEHFKEYDHVTVSDFYKLIMNYSNFQFYTIEENDMALGYVWIEIKEYKENAFRKSYKSIYVHQLNILEAHRNKGLGKKIMNKVNDIAELNNIKKIELDYWSKNDSAKNFYEKNGYIRYREFLYKDL